ncbi:hypothetical protein CALK_2060 [Chitinivibrio alkaliphilus ACht1]|uniref:Uncharacterized protein n=1 Tax=Chitinivibrio alkaliphilus ACht1 TaxID=1313304 RepID=U7D7M3_9BACT|nr:hypothetical protein CALK_2060 [Chitinivibrio alkaliphilus ACht1]
MQGREHTSLPLFSEQDSGIPPQRELYFVRAFPDLYRGHYVREVYTHTEQDLAYK